MYREEGLCRRRQRLGTRIDVQVSARKIENKIGHYGSLQSRAEKQKNLGEGSHAHSPGQTYHALLPLVETRWRSYHERVIGKKKRSEAGKHEKIGKMKKRGEKRKMIEEKEKRGEDRTAAHVHLVKPVAAAFAPGSKQAC